MLCPHCGEKIEESGLFCSACGKKLEDNHTVQHTGQFQEKRYHAEKDKGFSYLASYKTIKNYMVCISKKTTCPRSY